MCSHHQETQKYQSVLIGLLLFFILFVALFLRTQHLTNVTYVFDESFSLKMAEFSFVELWQRVSEDTHPPLSFLLLKFWGMLFGTSMFATRLFGVTFGVITIIGVYLFVKEAYSADAGSKLENSNTITLAALLAATFVALSPIHVSWSLIARMYSLGTALTAFSSWFLMRALHQRSSKNREWVFFTLLVIALAYTHHFGLFIIAGQYCFAVGYLWFQKSNAKGLARLQQLRPVIISALIFFWIWQPVFLNLFDQSHRVTTNFYTKPFALHDVSNAFYRLFLTNKWPSQTQLIGLIIAQVTFLVFVVLLLGRRPADSFIFLVSAITFVMAIVYSLTSRNIFKARYFQFTHLFLFVAAAIMICRIPNKLLRNSTIILAITGMGLCSYWNYQLREKKSEHPGMQAAIKRFDTISNTSEPLIVCNPLLYTTAIRCSANRDRIFTYTHNIGREYPFYQGSSVMLDSDYINPTMISETNVKWIWTLDESRWLKRKVPLPRDWKLVAETSFPDFYCELILRLYERNSPTKNQHKISLLQALDHEHIYSLKAIFR